ncbi:MULTISPECIES: DUF1656 domain-containing protein [unclassified Aeromonas]|uniref:DUF1656 domain-containing protein n=1 Tax=unclassified Aeromonas TaxID=257493 RepID=UPI003527E01A
MAGLESAFSRLPTGSPLVTTSALPDLILGASLYFPPLFKAVLLGLLGWLPVHHLLRGWLYGGDVWHPLLMDLSLFILAVSGALWILLHG